MRSAGPPPSLRSTARPPGPAGRTRALARALFGAHLGRDAWPVGSIVLQGSFSAVLCALARDELPPFAYATFALSVVAALVALPLLGDLGPLLRRDPAEEWAAALPAARRERDLARTIVLLALLAFLAGVTALPAALFAPSEWDLASRVVLLGSGLLVAVFVAAVLLGLQAAFGERAEGALVLLQTLLFAGAVVGLVAGMRYVPHLAAWSRPEGALAYWPPAWFAAWQPDGEVTPAWRLVPLAATLAALALLLLAPAPPATRARPTGGLLPLLLAPLRALATRAWVRRDERAVFDLVQDALPREREFVLRTYPLVGIPLAFLVVGTRGEVGFVRDALLSVLLFTPAAYLPILLVHVPATATPEARWILDTAPVQAGSVVNGAVKALVLRFLVPLYAALALVTALVGSPDLALRLVPPAFLVNALVLRIAYPSFVADLPLSRAPSEVEARIDWTGPMFGLGLGLTLLAIAAALALKSVWVALLATALLAAADAAADRRQRREHAHAWPVARE